MDRNTKQFKEQFQDDFSIRHKVTTMDEKPGFHIHDEFELLFVLSDGMNCTVGGKTYFLPRNTLLLFNDMDLHHIRMTGPGINDRYVVYFKPEYVAALSSQQTDLLECFFFRPFPDPNILPLTDVQSENLLTLLGQIETLCPPVTEGNRTSASKSYGDELRIKLRLAELLLEVNSLYRKQHGIVDGAIDPHYSTVYNIMYYIHKNYWNELSLDFLSKEFYINKFYLCTLFKSVTGTSVNQYLIQCRLMKAKELLLNHETVENVCAKVGYNNLSNFSRTFKNHTGLSPKQYQMAHSGAFRP